MNPYPKFEKSTSRPPQIGKRTKLFEQLGSEICIRYKFKEVLLNDTGISKKSVFQRQFYIFFIVLSLALLNAYSKILRDEEVHLRIISLLSSLYFKYLVWDFH